MPNDPFYIICPYYHKVIGNNIFCEGFAGDETLNPNECRIKQSFATREERNECVKKYCAGFDYSHCRIAIINEVLQRGVLKKGNND